MKYIFVTVALALGIVLGLIFGSWFVQHWDYMSQGKPALTEDNCMEVNWLGYDACTRLHVKDNTINYINEGDTWELQPAAGYRLLTPMATKEYHVFNEPYAGNVLVATTGGLE